MATEQSNQTIVLNLLRDAVPERADKITELWQQYSHEVEVVQSTTGVTMNANEKCIQLSTKTIDLFWLLGFSLWRAIEVYSPAMEMATSCGMTLDKVLEIDDKRGEYELDFKQHIDAAHALLLVEQTRDISWPEDLPKPTACRNSLINDQHKATFGLVLFALAFTLLHEFKHVMFCADKSAPSTLPEEELACDIYARDFMMSGLAEYAKKHGHEYVQVQQKRAMGIVLAAMIIHTVTTKCLHWG